jgi:Flp pilus assembly protein TadG
LSPKPLNPLRSALRLASGFARAEGGNVALWTAASVLPIAMAVGAATDFRRLETARSLVQDASDAAVLAAAKVYLSEGKGRGERSRRAAEDAAGEALRANLKGREALVGALRWNLKVEDGEEFTVLTRARTPAAFGGLFGVKDLPVRVSSSASTGMRRVEVALVLDNTGSMYGRKLDTLKTSAADLVDRLAAIGAGRADSRAIRIALVPFSMTVNVGAQHAGANWMDRDARSPVHRALFQGVASDVNRFDLFKAMNKTWGGCVESRPYPHDVRETEPSNGKPETLFVPYFAPDEPGDGTTSGVYPNDYLADTDPAATLEARQGEVAKYADGKPRTGWNEAGYEYGPNAGCHLTPLVRLTHEPAKVKTAVAGMRAVGDTNIPMGLAWGWHALSPDGPFGDGVEYRNRDTVKIAVLMTDGQNNVTPYANHNGALYSGVGYMWQRRLGVGVEADQAARRQALDERLAELCTNMKRRGIVIYTIRVEVTEGSDQVLRACATRPEGFFNVQDVRELPEVFDTIADSITGLRLSR